jgi:phospholipid/cholesterol/gamma-HCH transport system substrate-binding protein
MKGNAVTSSGLTIGQVDDIFFSKDKNTEVIVELIISNDLEIPDNSFARLLSSDLLGSKVIEIDLGDSKTYLSPRDTIRSDIAMSLQEEVNQMVQPILKRAGSMMSSIDTVITAVGLVLDVKTRANLMTSIESLKNTLANIENVTYSADTLMKSESTRLAGIFANVESITANLKQNNDELTRIISNAANISDTIAKFNLSTTLSNLERSINNLTATSDKISRGEGNIGLLINDDKLYNELESSSKQLDLLLQDIRLNPKRYVHFSIFGKTPKVTSTSSSDTL